MANIFIIDNDNKLTSELINKINEESGLVVLGKASNGKEGLQFIKNYNGFFDIIIIDLLLPICSGINVIDEIFYNYKDKVNKIIVTSSFFSLDTLEYINNGMISYTLLKPFSLETIMNAIKSISKHSEIEVSNIFLNNNNNYKFSSTIDQEKKLRTCVEKDITQLLYDLGVPVKVKGFTFLRIALVECFFNTEYLGQITKLLYPDIAKKCDSNSISVERTIRFAIKYAALHGNKNFMYKMFKKNPMHGKQIPTNGEFFAQITDILRGKYNISINEKKLIF